MYNQQRQIEYKKPVKISQINFMNYPPHSIKEKIKLSIYQLYLKLIDISLIKRPKYRSDLYKYSTIRLLVEHFDGRFGHDTCIDTANLGFGLIHASLINNLKPEQILCIGSKKGFIPAICAMACKNNKHGAIDFVDAAKDRNDKNSWGGTAFWKKVNPNKHFSLFNLNKYITTHIMTSRQFAKKYPKRKFDYIYIDADHSYKGIKFDYQTFWPRLTVGGIIAFHDIKIKGLNQGVEYGVWKLWKEIKEKGKFSFNTHDNALGFIQKNE